MQSLKRYLPAALFLLAGLVFLNFPELAAVILAFPLITLGILYAYFVFKWHSIQKNGHNYRDFGGLEQEIYADGDVPGMKDFTITIIKRYSSIDNKYT